MDRFWKKVNKDGPVPENHPEFGPCWLWTGTLHDHGYGRITERVNVGKSRQMYAHRLAWQEASGALLTDDEDVCHTCDVPACVRNDEAGVYDVNGRSYVRLGHLFVGDQVTNNSDRDTKGRLPLGEQRHESKLTDDGARSIRTLYLTGTISITALSRAFGVSWQTVRDVLAGTLWKHISTEDIRPMGKDGRTKLTAEEREAIRTATGVTQAELARRYGVDQGYVSQLRSGKR